MTMKAEDKMNQRTTITIARQMGAAALISDRLSRGVGAEICGQRGLTSRARALGVAEAEVEASREKLTSLWERLLGGITILPPESPYTPRPSARLPMKSCFQRQVEALKLIAAEEDCVIVGYGGAFVLPRHTRMSTSTFTRRSDSVSSV